MRSNVFYIQFYVLLLLISCNGKKIDCEKEKKIFDGNLIEFNSEEDWDEIIINKELLIIDNFYLGRKWDGNTYMFKSDDLCYFYIQMNSEEAKRIRDLYKYHWETNITTLSREYRIYTEVDSVNYLGLSGGGIGASSQFNVFGRLFCLEISTE